MKTPAILLSGGTGTRIASDIPKQYISVSGRMIVTTAILRLYLHPRVDAVQIVAAPEWREPVETELREALCGIGAASQKPVGFSDPGEARQLSVWNALSDLKEAVSEDAVVLVHDAARPLVSDETIAACFDACVEYDGAMPVLPMKDTVYYSESGTGVDRLLNRDHIFAGQAPEAFRFAAYYDANAALFPDRIRTIRGSSEPAVMAGMRIAMLPGDEGNFKITTPADLENYIDICSRQKIDSRMN